VRVVHLGYSPFTRTGRPRPPRCGRHRPL